MDYSTAADAATEFKTFITKLLADKRGIDLPGSRHESIAGVLSDTVQKLYAASRTLEADALDQVHDKVTRPASLGGLGLADNVAPEPQQYEEVLFLCDAYIQSVQSQELSQSYLNTNPTRAHGTKPMTLAQKIFTQHALGSDEAKHGLPVGEVVRVGVDWVIASELSWAGMASTYEELGSPGIWRNDRFWIAGDHVVHPSIADNPKIKAYVETAEKAKRDFQMTE